MGYGCAPMKLQKQAVDWIWHSDCNLQAPDINNLAPYSANNGGQRGTEYICPGFGLRMYPSLKQSYK